jgi:hypothetical protein
MLTLDHRSYAADVAPPPRDIIRVTPTRKFIDKRFPTLGFTVDTGGRPFFEVLLTTDRALFDAANAARRTPATFYASREHSGLIRAGDEPAVYLVPNAVIQRFAGAREIFYTAACYESAQGQDPAYAIQPAQLPREAPSVGVASDFHGRSLAASFAIPVEALLRVRDDDVQPSMAMIDVPAVVAPAYGDADLDADLDRAGGEDGYGLSAAIDDDDGSSSAAQEADEPAPAAESLPAAGTTLDYYDGYDEPIEAPAAAAEEGRAYGDDGEDEYAPATAQQSTFEAGASVPPMLLDEDEDQREHDGEYGTEAAYGEEGDEQDAPAPAYQSLDAPVPLTPREQRRIMDTVLAVVWPCPSGYAAVVPETEPASVPSGGLSFGILPFTQWSGALGELMKAMDQRDSSAFQRTFGPKWKDLRDTATAAKAADRMKAVESKELWREPWLTRFRKAGEHKAFQAAQNETAARLCLQPMVPVAYGLGLNTDRGLVMLAALLRRISFNVEFAVAAARDWVVTAVSPFRTDAQRQQALTALGSAFQQAQHIDPAKPWNNVQHYAVLTELRKSGRSPVPLPTRSEMLDLMVKYATDYRDPSATELAHLRTIACLKDVEYVQ